VDLLKKLGEKVTKGEPLYRVHAQFPSDFRFARSLVETDSGYRIGGIDEIPDIFAEF
jgi:thymidine phosphorylase